MEARQKAAEKMKKLSRTKTDSVESNSMEGEKKICERGCPNKFEVGETQCSEAQNYLRAKRATFTKKCVFRSKKFRFEHFFVNCKMKMAF